MLFYHIWTLPILTNIYVAKTKQRMADTHLSIETTYIAYPICYTMMLPNMPFRKADAHPLRLNTRCKDLTLVPSSWLQVLLQTGDHSGLLLLQAHCQGTEHVLQEKALPGLGRPTVVLRHPSLKKKHWPPKASQVTLSKVQETGGIIPARTHPNPAAEGKPNT